MAGRADLAINLVAALQLGLVELAERPFKRERNVGDMLDGMAASYSPALREAPQPPLVVFVTAHTEHAVHAFELEAVDYLTKPVDLRQFRQVVASAIQGIGAVPAPGVACTDAFFTPEQLLTPCDGERTEEGMRANIRVAVQYIEAWISGNGCVPIYGLMEDAATAEISRTSIWQWIHHQKTLSNGKPVTKSLFRQMLAEEMRVIQDELGEHRFSSGRFDDAARLMEQITTSDDLIDFLTLPGYRLLA